MSVGSMLDAIDRYSWKAHIRPVVLALLPVAALVAATAPAWAKGGTAWVLVLLAGALLLAEPLGRAGGKKLEESLFTVWGGKPTVQMLRYSGPLSDTHLSYLHTQVQEIIGPSLRLPSAAEEHADPGRADEIYETVGSILRGRARSLRGSQLVAEHNSEYGFRRNALGLRRWALAACLISLAGLAAAAVWAGMSHEPVSISTVVIWSVLTFTSIGMLAFWFFVVRPGWVETAAWEYARQLYETVAVSEVGNATG